MSIGTAYFGNRIPRHVAADMDALAERGFTGVLHTYSENDLAYYSGTMNELVRLSHDAGLEVIVGPWGLCQMFGGEAFGRFIGANPELGQILEDGRWTPAGCPNQPRVREFVHRWIDAAVQTGAERIFCDEPHWVHPQHFGLDPAHWGCRCDACIERFGRELPRELTPEVQAFREASMIDFIGDFVAEVARQGARPAICPLPLSDGAHGISDWSKLAALPGLDTLGTDPYWEAFDQEPGAFVGEYASRVATLSREHGLTPQIWIQGFRVQPGDIAPAVRAAREAGIEDLWVWAYEACAHMTSLRPDDPEAVWEAICDELVGVRR